MTDHNADEPTTNPTAGEVTEKRGDLDAVDGVESTASKLSTAPAPVQARIKVGRLSVGRLLLRWWRQLTSMRTALVLLFLLAVAAVPGSLLPQQSLNPDKVEEYSNANPQLAPIIDKLGGFDVYASPWFAAIYLALVVSLLGCLTPRIRLHFKAMRQPPPAAPKHLNRLRRYAAIPVAVPKSAAEKTDSAQVSATVEPIAVAARTALRRRHWRTVRTEKPDGTVEISAEKGYLRETGNLVFHIALVVLLGGMAVGGMWGWTGNVLVTEGEAFCDSTQQYDTYQLGRNIAPEDLPPFCLNVKKVNASFLPTGQPETYSTDVDYDDGQGGAARPARIAVNEPLRFDGARLYMIDQGYTPVITYTDRYGQKFSSPSPFLPQDPNLSSNGVAVFPEANQRPGAARQRDVEVAFDGTFTPTAPTEGPKVRSTHPAPNSPALTIAAYRGDTGLSTGIPKSVYSLDQRQIQRGKLKMVGAKSLKLGESWKLDDGTTVTFAGLKQWAGLRVDSNPGQVVVLIAAIFVVAGLFCSLRIRRRRMWVRIRPPAEAAKASKSGPFPPGAVRVETGGLARTEWDTFGAEFDRLTAEITANVPTDDSGEPDHSGDPHDSGESSPGTSKEGARNAR